MNDGTAQPDADHTRLGYDDKPTEDPWRLLNDHLRDAMRKDDETRQREKAARSGRRKTNATRIAAVLIGLSLALVLLRPVAAPNQNSPDQVKLTEAEKLIRDKQVKEASIDDGARLLVLTVDNGDGERKVETNYPLDYSTELVKQLDAAEVPTKVDPPAKTSLIVQFIFSFLPILLILGVLVYFMRAYTSGAARGLGKRGNEVEVPAARFTDVAGAVEAVEDLTEVVDYLKNPASFERYGGRAPRGILLVGPSGTGKTLLARATAGEAGVPFYALSGSDFVETFVGVGARRVRDVFDKARKAERAIVFIDEIDAVGKSRGGPSNGANDEREHTLNALLVEMDGFQRGGVVVIAATNRPDTLDSALTRPGRFDRQVIVGAPDKQGRKDLFRLYLQRAWTEPGADLDRLAEDLAVRTGGMTGADAEAIMNEAALAAARRNTGPITAEDIHNALERVALGRERRSAVVSEKGRAITAWHEAGHAICALTDAELANPSRVSIVPRGTAGGVTWVGESDENFLTRNAARARLTMMLGGRAAEEILLDGDFTQGASSDLAGASNLARKMVCEWGMADTLVSVDAERYLGSTAAAVDERVEAILVEAMGRAREVVNANRAGVEAVVGALVEHETLSAERLEAVAAGAGVVVCGPEGGEYMAPEGSATGI